MRHWAACALAGGAALAAINIASKKRKESSMNLNIVDGVAIVLVAIEQIRLSQEVKKILGKPSAGKGGDNHDNG